MDKFFTINRTLSHIGIGLLLIAASCDGWAQTYYVDATLGSDVWDGKSKATAWKTIDKVNRFSFLPGDSILFKRGEVLNGQGLTILSSGVAGKPITFSAYGVETLPKPKISSAKKIDSASWVLEPSGEYSLDNYTNARIVLLENGKRLKGTDEASTLPGPLPGSLSAGEWGWDATTNKIYYKPTTGQPSDHLVEIAYGYADSVHVTGDYLVLQNLDIYGSYGYVMYLEGNEITIRNSLVHGGRRGLEAHLSANVTIKNNEVYDINWKGIGIMNGTAHSLVAGNHVYDIGKLDTDDGDLEGILVGGAIGQPRPSDAVVENNLIENIGRDWYPGKDGTINTGLLNSVGIVADAVTDIVIRNNTIRNCWRRGVSIESSSAVTERVTIYGNLLHNIGLMSSVPWGTAAFMVSSTQGYPVSNVSIFNNTIANGKFFGTLWYKNEAPFKLLADGHDDSNDHSGLSDVYFANNIIDNIDADYSMSFEIKNGATLSGYVSENNLISNITSNGIFRLLPAETSTVKYGVSYIIGTSACADASCNRQAETNSLTAPPLFRNRAAYDFQLAAGSPAINGGAEGVVNHAPDFVNDISTARSADMKGQLLVGAPDIGAFEYAPTGLSASITDPVLPGGAVTYDETVSNSGTGVATEVGGIDLMPTAFTALGSGNIKGSGNVKVLISDTVKNQGTASSPSFYVRYYLSTDTTYESGVDIALARYLNGTGICERMPSSLSNGVTSSVSNKPCYRPTGAADSVEYYVLVVNDATGARLESNESNNVLSTAGTIKW